MFLWYQNLSLIYQVLIATFITWTITSLGSAIVFIFKKVNKNVLDSMMGLSAGVMISASFFSLLEPSIKEAYNMNMSIIIVCLGFIIGGLFLIITDILLDKRLNNSSLKRDLMLILSITLHNIPEGLAIGVAYGSIRSGNTTLLEALMLAVGIGIQNFPEGCAISMPLRRDNYSRFKSFLYGSLSGIVEPISAVLGCLLVLKIKNIMPFSLSFAGGAMIFVVVKELIPESMKNKHSNIIALFAMLGFTLMMFLDVTFS